MKWFIAYRDAGEINIREYSTRDEWIKAIDRMGQLGIDVICFWSEP